MNNDGTIIIDKLDAFVCSSVAHAHHAYLLCRQKYYKSKIWELQSKLFNPYRNGHILGQLL